MAIYHLHVGIVSRSSGRSSVAAAAYRAAEKLRNVSSAVNAAAYRSGESLQDEQHSAVHDYRRKYGVVHTEIMLPENAPREFEDRATLWNAVEKAESRKDAQTARDIDMALPIELNRQEQITLVREYVKENFVNKGMCADFAIHDKADGNPHAHVMLTTREVTGKGFGKKNREWNDKAHLKSWRESWAFACNEQLQAKGLDTRIDHRTLEAQGINREPTKHIGVAAKHMERRGLQHNRAKQNRDIVTRNENKRRLATEQRQREKDRQERARMEEQERPQNIAQRMHQIKKDYISLDKEIRSLQGATAKARLAPLIKEQNSLRLEYQRQKVHANISLDRQKIHDSLAELEKENRQHRRSVQDNLTWLRCERVLDTITERDFHEIVRKAKPEHVQALIEQREREREHERMRPFERGR